MIVPGDQVQINGQVQEHSVSADSGAVVSNFFYPSCGSQVYRTGELTPDMTFIVASTLDDPKVFRPEVSLYTSKALSCDQPHADTQTFETMPDSVD